MASFPDILTEPVPRCNVGPGLEYSVDFRLQTYIRNRGFVEIWKTRHKISADILDIFTVYAARIRVRPEVL